MAARVPARLTAAEGRKFGLTVGLAFVALGLAMLWRGHRQRATVVLSLGALFVIAGLVIPTHLGPVERAWMRLAHLISKVTTPVFMGIVYFLIITPIGFVRTRFGGTPLIARERPASRWSTHRPAVGDAARMERQF